MVSEMNDEFAPSNELHTGVGKLVSHEWNMESYYLKHNGLPRKKPGKNLKIVNSICLI
jgi:hypothetical protein